MSDASIRNHAALRALLQARRSIRVYSEQPVARAALERMILLAQGDTPDRRRHAPSAHGLYPLSIFVWVRRLDDVSLAPGLHNVYRQSGCIGDFLRPIVPGALLDTSLADDVWLEQAAAVLVVAADYDAARAHFVDHQPDGLRGDCYVHIETGAMLQNMHLAAVTEGLGGVIVAGFDDAKLAAVLDLPRRLAPVSLFCVGVPAA